MSDNNKDKDNTTDKFTKEEIVYVSSIAGNALGNAAKDCSNFYNKDKDPEYYSSDAMTMLDKFVEIFIFTYCQMVEALSDQSSEDTLSDKYLHIRKLLAAADPLSKRQSHD